MSDAPGNLASTEADDVGDANIDSESEIEERDPYKRRVAVVLALLGVLGGWIGILRMDSANNESNFARETTRTAVSSLRANVNQSTVQGLGIDIDAEQAALGLAAPFSTDTSGEVTAAVDSDVELEEASAGIDAQDREVLERELTTEAEALDLKRKALAETRVTYNNRTSQYETVLTTLAVALFLVGFTLVLGRKTRPPVLVPGLILAAYVAGWAVWIHQREIPTTDPAAIEAAAEASTHESFGEFELATERYTESIEIDGDFIPAHTGRSTSSFLAANPDFARNLAVVDIDGPLVEQAMADAERAIELGDDKNFGSLLVSGIYRFEQGDYDGARERLEAAIEINDRAPEALLLLSATELADGDRAAADAALDSAIALLDLREATNRNRAFAADLFTLLEQVETAVPDRAADAAEVRGRLAVGEAGLLFGEEVSGELPAGVEFAVDRNNYADGTLDVALTYAGLPDDSKVSVYLFEQPAEGAPFAQSAELARFAPLSGSGVIDGVVDIERACQPVAFRYDIYVEGALAASLDAPGGPATC